MDYHLSCCKESKMIINPDTWLNDCVIVKDHNYMINHELHFNTAIA